MFEVGLAALMGVGINGEQVSVSLLHGVTEDFPVIRSAVLAPGGRRNAAGICEPDILQHAKERCIITRLEANCLEPLYGGFRGDTDLPHLREQGLDLAWYCRVREVRHVPSVPPSSDVAQFSCPSNALLNGIPILFRLTHAQIEKESGQPPDALSGDDNRKEPGAKARSIENRVE